ncbi:hypothetical protein C2S51_000571 [Perilla frutescens var. frutescens]|nr:hypothetical protein C2S51_000571 [Perilla frutescens var. frutescens]
MAGKGRQNYGRAATSSSTLVLYGLIMLTLLIVILLAVGILSSSGNSKHKANDLNIIAHNSLHSHDGGEECKDQWVEVIFRLFKLGIGGGAAAEREGGGGKLG